MIRLCSLLAIGSLVQPTKSFVPSCYGMRKIYGASQIMRQEQHVLYLSSSEKDETDLDAIESLPPEEKKKVVGNLVEDDEWNGLTMELSGMFERVDLGYEKFPFLSHISFLLFFHLIFYRSCSYVKFFILSTDFWFVFVCLFVSF